MHVLLVKTRRGRERESPWTLSTLIQERKMKERKNERKKERKNKDERKKENEEGRI